MYTLSCFIFNFVTCRYFWYHIISDARLIKNCTARASSTEDGDKISVLETEYYLVQILTQVNGEIFLKFTPGQKYYFFGKAISILLNLHELSDIKMIELWITLLYKIDLTRLLFYNNRARGGNTSKIMLKINVNASLWRWWFLSIRESITLHRVMRHFDSFRLNKVQRERLKCLTYGIVC